MDIVQKLLHDLQRRKAESDSRLLPTPSTVREPSLSEANAVYTPPNYGLLFCPHGKSYFDLCSACKRTRSRAQEEYRAFCKRHGLELT